MDLYIEKNNKWYLRGAQKKKINRSSSDEENSIANVVHFTATVSKVCIDIKKYL